MMSYSSWNCPGDTFSNFYLVLFKKTDSNLNCMEQSQIKYLSDTKEK